MLPKVTNATNPALPASTLKRSRTMHLLNMAGLKKCTVALLQHGWVKHQLLYKYFGFFLSEGGSFWNTIYYYTPVSALCEFSLLSLVILSLAKKTTNPHMSIKVQLLLLWGKTDANDRSLKQQLIFIYSYLKFESQHKQQLL